MAQSPESTNADGKVDSPPHEDPAMAQNELSRQGEHLTRLEPTVDSVLEPKEQYRVSGYLQVDWGLLNQLSQNEVNHSNGAPLNQERFTLKRGHLRLDARHGYLAAAFELDANTVNGPQLRLINAEVSLSTGDGKREDLPKASLSAGLIRIPFGFELQESDASRPFLERTTAARALYPGQFDLGAQLQGQFRVLDLRVAVMNGSPIGSRTFPGLAPTNKKSFIGRLGAHIPVGSGILLDFGVSADSGTGFHQGTPTTKDQLVWRDDNGDGIVQSTEIQVIAGTSMTASQEFHRFALGADARVAFRFRSHAEFALRSEIIRSSNLDRAIEPADPVAAGYDLRELGWTVGATQEATKWCLVGARYDRYAPDEDARLQQGASLVPRKRFYTTVALLVMLRYQNARLSAEYDLNRNALGRDVSGSPTNLKSNALTLRAQARF
jgi:hypothetical protein